MTIKPSLFVFLFTYGFVYSLVCYRESQEPHRVVPLGTQNCSSDSSCTYVGYNLTTSLSTYIHKGCLKNHECGSLCKLVQKASSCFEECCQEDFCNRGSYPAIACSDRKPCLNFGTCKQNTINSTYCQCNNVFKGPRCGNKITDDPICFTYKSLTTAETVNITQKLATLSCKVGEVCFGGFYSYGDQNKTVKEGGCINSILCPNPCVNISHVSGKKLKVTSCKQSCCKENFCNTPDKEYQITTPTPIPTPTPTPTPKTPTPKTPTTTGTPSSTSRRKTSQGNNEMTLGTAEKVGIGISVAVFLIIAVIIIAFVCYKRRKKGPLSPEEQQKEDKLNAEIPMETSIISEIPPGGYENLSVEHDIGVKDPWEVDPEDVTFLEELGKGAFGKVYKGILKQQLKEETVIFAKLTGKSLNKTQRIVAIKILHETAEAKEKVEFVKEINLMKKLGCHQNIVNFLCCCTLSEPHFLVVEFLPKGDLLKYLRINRHKISGFEDKETAPAYLHTKMAFNKDTIDELEGEYIKMKGNDDSQTEKSNEMQVDEDTLTPKDLISFSCQIATGMEYLSSKGLVHRDLAARNILVANKKQVKVSDFGLTRDLYEESAYRSFVQRKLPIKWMSPEAIYDQVFTTESDVWSYGILLWEISTLGGTPYPTISGRNLYRQLRRGYRMEKPDMCSEEMYNITRRCWEQNPSDRPSFTELRQEFEEMLQKDNPYVDFSNLDIEKDFYTIPSLDSESDESLSD